MFPFHGNISLICLYTGQGFLSQYSYVRKKEQWKDFVSIGIAFSTLTELLPVS